MIIRLIKFILQIKKLRAREINGFPECLRVIRDCAGTETKNFCSVFFPVYTLPLEDSGQTGEGFECQGRNIERIWDD